MTVQQCLITPSVHRRALTKKGGNPSREALVDDLEISLTDVSKYQKQTLEFIHGNKKPNKSKFLISDLPTELLNELGTFSKSDVKYILKQAVTKLFEDAYFKRWHNPKWNYTKNGFSWHSFQLYGCCIPDVELKQ